MKILKIPVWWSAQEAESILLALDELRIVIVQNYGDDIQRMHERTLQDEEAHLNLHLHENDWNDDIPF